MLVAVSAALLLAWLAVPVPAFADGDAVIPTSASPGTSPSLITNYHEVDFPANDDGTWPCGGDGNESPECPGPDGETGPTAYPLGFSVDFYGTEYDSAYINNNGNITFAGPLSQYTPSELTTFGSPIIAPFFADVDTTGDGSAIVNFGTGTLDGYPVFVVNWPGVGCYNAISSVLDDFQLVLIDRPDEGTSELGDDFDIEYNYDSIQWDTGQASGGDDNCENGPQGNSAYVGFSNGSSTPGDSYELPGSGDPNALLDTTESTGLINNSVASTTPGRYIFSVTNGEPGIDIFSAPDPETNSTTATFEFTTGEDNGTYTCSLDGGAFTPCTSPQTYTGLADGHHTFEVEAQSGDETGLAGSYSWSIYTQPPVITIDSSPSGTVTSQSAAITFHGTAEDGDTAGIEFSCSLDGAGAAPCSSPYTVNDLAPGQHQVSIVATDDVGNVSQPTTVSWTVTNSAPPLSTCTAPKQSVAASGLLFMQAASGTCLTPVALTAGTAFRTTGAVTVDGITVTPTGATAITLAPAGGGSTLSSNGPVTVKLGSLPAVSVQRLSWTQSAHGLSTGTSPLLSTLGGLTVNVSNLSASASNGGSVTVTLTVTLPKSFSSLPGFPRGISADLTITASNKYGVDFSGQINVASLYIGTIQLKNLAIGYDTQSGLFTGSVAIWPTPFGPNIATSLQVGPASSESVLGCCVRSFSIIVQKINEPIADTGLFLQSIGGSGHNVTGSGGVSYPEFVGNIGLSLGPSTNNNPAAIDLNGSLTLDLSSPWKLTANGSATVDAFSIANAEVAYTQGQGVALTGSVQANIHGYGFAAKIVPPTFFEANGLYNITATGEVDLGDRMLQGTIVFSNKGLAACAPVTFGGVSLSLGWGEIDGVPTAVGDSCDMSPFSETATATRSSTPATVLHLRLSADRLVRLLAIHGASGVPQVALSGPAGLHFEAGPRAMRGPRWLALSDTQTNTTYLLVSDAPAGRYTLRSLDTPILSVQVASSLPRVAVHIATRALPDGRRRLTYTQIALLGQELELYEDGRSGIGRLLVQTTASHGTVVFTPQPGLGTRRSILAVTVSRSGLTRDTETLAPYRIDDRPLGPVRQLAQRDGILRWSATPRAARYVLAFTRTAAPTDTITTTAHSAKIPTGATLVAIVATDAAGRPGPTRTLTLRRFTLTRARSQT